MKNLVEPIRDKKLIQAVEQLLAKQSVRNRLIWVFGTNTGLRISDILGLNVEDVRNKDYIEIQEEKTGKYKRFALNDKLKKLINVYLIERDKQYSITGDEPLFLGKKHCRLDRSQMYRIINDACETLNLHINVGNHTMRKTFGYHHYKKYKDVVMLQKIFNHSAPWITLKYIGITQDEIDEAYKNFEL